MAIEPERRRPCGTTRLIDELHGCGASRTDVVQHDPRGLQAFNTHKARHSFPRTLYVQHPAAIAQEDRIDARDSVAAHYTSPLAEPVYQLATEIIAERNVAGSAFAVADQERALAEIYVGNCSRTASPKRKPVQYKISSNVRISSGPTFAWRYLSAALSS